MHPAIQKLINYLGDNETAQTYLQLAMQSFFGDLAEQQNLATLEDISGFLGEEAFEQIYPVMLEFFFTNIYEGEDGTWNMIDAFLAASDAEALTQNERSYLQALRQSVMSVYEVTSVELDQGATVRDMVRGGDSFFVSERMMTHSIAKWDCMGVRVLDMGTHYVFSGAGVRLARSRAEALAPELKKMRDMIVSMYPAEDPSVASDQVAHYAEVMWASEIGAAWMEQVLQEQSGQAQTLCNNEGHPIYPVKIHVPVTGSPEKVEDALDDDDDFEPESDNEWLWLQAPEGEESETNPAIARGYVALNDNALVMYVNSRQRANILEDRIATLTKGHTGEPEWEEPEDVAPGSAQAFALHEEYVQNEADDDNNGGDDEGPDEEAQDEIILQMKDQHYRSWMKSRIPALENKTPKMARRTKKGREQLIALLKDMENAEAHNAREQDIPAYDMRWMWEELGLDREMV